MQLADNETIRMIQLEQLKIKREYDRYEGIGANYERSIASLQATYNQAVNRYNSIAQDLNNRRNRLAAEYDSLQTDPVVIPGALRVHSETHLHLTEPKHRRRSLTWV